MTALATQMIAWLWKEFVEFVWLVLALLAVSLLSVGLGGGWMLLLEALI